MSQNEGHGAAGTIRRSRGLVAMTFIHTDVDDFPAAVGEAARVLRSGGRLIA
jgi:ubiquinone/menaquinone biosynthesis C-methylase UbiE